MMFTPLVHQVAYPDVAPVMLLSEASVKDLSSKLETDVTVERFRPNIVIGDCEAFEEDSWEELQIGSVRLQRVMSCGRCIFTTVDPETGIINRKEPLETLKSYRLCKPSEKHLYKSSPLFGQLHAVKRTGILQVGDVVFKDSWEELQIGSVRLQRVMSCGRCIFTTVDPETGIINRKEPLETLKSYRLCKPSEKHLYKSSPLFGQLHAVKRTGILQVGDVVFKPTLSSECLVLFHLSEVIISQLPGFSRALDNFSHLEKGLTGVRSVSRRPPTVRFCEIMCVVTYCIPRAEQQAMVCSVYRTL
ncbi:hypothetical protein F2P81_003029 [Scophthalmus maximus]|uniref:MOSC domain-containing protein n=1 Tax=Scophthalmus maximus TaxID=52904 RepID=A0A6A4TM29_SCOMX|nr:hypothetical protein F2P81_003029 [Scophthalmus maximus]